MLRHDAFEIISSSSERIAELGVLIVDKRNTPLEARYIEELTELTPVYNIVRDHIILNNGGTAIIGTLGEDDNALNALILQLKQLAKIFSYPEIPSPVNSFTTSIRANSSILPVGMQGDLMYHDGTDWVAFAKGSDGDTLVSTPTGIQWQSVVGNGIPSGGSTGQFLVKNSNTSYDTLWASPALSMFGVSVSAANINQLSGISGNVQTQINDLANSIGNGIGNSLQNGYFLVGNGSDVATAVAPSGDVTFNNLGVFQLAPGSVHDNDVAADAAITRSKLATGTANRILINNASGILNDAAAIEANRILVSNADGIPVASGIAAASINYLDVSASISTSLASKLTVSLTSPAQGDVIYYNGTSWVNLTIGTNGQVLKSNGTTIEWDNGTSNGLPSGGAQNYYLRKSSASDYATEWHELTLSDITDINVPSSEINLLNGLTVGSSLINLLTGATGNIQNQLSNKLPISLTHHSLWVGGASDTAQQLSAGVDNSVLTIVSGHPTWQTPPTPGTFSGPVSSTDNAVVRFNGTTGISGQDSGVIIDDSNNVTGVATLSSGQISILDQAVLRLYETGSTNYVGLRASGTMAADYTITLPAAAPGTNTYLKYDGTNYVWASVSGGGGTALNQKTEPGATYSITDADDGYIIYFTNACEVTMPNTVSNNISVTTVRLGGLVEHLDDGTSTLNTIGSEYNIEEVGGAATWVKNGSTAWYGWGSLGPAPTGGGGGTVVSVSGTANRISVGGTSTDPVIDISTSYVGQSSITTLGTIATGVWQGTTIGTGYGGTGLSSLGTANQLLRVNAGATALEYFTPSFITGNQTITLSGVVTGSGATSISTTIADNAVTNGMFRQSSALSVVGNGTNATANVADITGTDGNALRVSGTTLAFGKITSAYVDSTIATSSALALKEDILDRATVTTTGGTITMDMNSIRQRMFVGSASFSTPKTIAMSNATNALSFNFAFTITDVNAELTMPADFLMSDINFDGSIWTPPSTGTFLMGGSNFGTNWLVMIAGPFA